ncbi:Lar family restriction alleviation protein [Mesorhizobium sp. CA8]|uniref:Lar family restriction alleviation protein n=1 Tax=Mesorhizobium sp. CA8 TaxID=2876637 RepID=UPI001CCEBFE8|nr:Lar family restriction alleviation protein [Mesorhizobium sp. CA8]MBZ9759451.1 Lar family restriction alleviation protein [Mesorhizobium sp. CA8]
MAHRLKACPFCGSRKTEPTQYHSIFFVVCRDCHADGPAKDSESDAIEAWNTRVTRKMDGDGH